MTEAQTPAVIIVALTHDLRRRQSVVTLQWVADPLKNVALPVPFGCGLGDVGAEAEKALRALSAETAVLTVQEMPA